MTTLNHWIFRQIFYGTLLLRREWFIPQYHEFLKSQFYPPYKLKEIQLKRLNSLLKHASQNIPYYKGRIPSNLESLDELSSLPFLEKEDVRSYREQLIHKISRHQRTKTSGGSTGAPVTLIKDSGGMALEMAAMWRGYSWAGVNIGDRQARFWGVPKSHKDKLRSQLIDFVCNRQRVTAFNFDVESMTVATNRLKNFNPDYFYGYSSILKEFALAQNGSSVLQPNAIITTSEVLSTSDRNEIENVFNCKVFDEYGCGEVGTIAHECEHGELHINCENLVLEVVNSEGAPVEAGEVGEVVVTDLTNWSMPLIRYRLKDFGELTLNSCGCGRTLPILKNIHGRAYDILENSDGSKYHGEFFLYIIEDAKKKGINVQAVQFVQKKYSYICVKIACRESDFKTLSMFIEDRLRTDFDSNVELKFENVTSIPREPSGKLRVVKREDF